MSRIDFQCAFSKSAPLLTTIFALSCARTAPVPAQSENAVVSMCIPGQQLSCPCPGQPSGAQVCQADGTFGGCACEAPADIVPTTAQQTPASRRGEKLLVGLVEDQSWLQSYSRNDPSACEGPESTVILVGDAGDFVTQGKGVKVVGRFIAGCDEKSCGVFMFPFERNRETTISVDFASPRNQLLRVGKYNVSFRKPTSTESPESELRVAYSSRTCSDTEGSFQIHKLEKRENFIVKLTATFELLCAGSSGRISGCVHITSPILEPAPALKNTAASRAH